MNVMAVVGAQFGSEGKGVIINDIAEDYDIHVRTGGPNAGHSFNFEDRIWKMQVIPCGWTNPNAILVIGRGALVDVELLEEEIETIEKAGYEVKHRLFVDAKAGVLDKKFRQEEGGIKGEMHARIGSTGEGVGAARIARIQRDPRNFKLVEDLEIANFLREDTVQLLHAHMRSGKDILLEG